MPVILRNRPNVRLLVYYTKPINVMKALLRFFPMAAVALFLTFFMTSCAAIGDIFKTGVWTGVILVVVGIGVIIWLISKLFGGGGSNS